MRVVVSVGGSVLAPDLDPERVAAHAAALDAAVEAGHEVAVVVGGGTVAREYIETARALDATEVELDRLGIGVTHLNARLLRTALDAPTARPDEYEGAVEAMSAGRVPVMGGVAPGQTTDAVAAALAEDARADLLIFATSVDGVYDADPTGDGEASRFDELTPAELVEVVAPMSRSAGASAPVDLLAAKLVERAGLRALVVDGTDPAVVERAVVEGEFDGTEVR